MSDVVQEFVAAFDRWAQSNELCGGPLFEEMVEARGKAETVYMWCEEDEDR